MTRFGFLTFQFLLMSFIYGLVWASGARAADITYMLWHFNLPYLILIVVMLLIASVRWFMSHDPEIAKEIVTWANTVWFVPALTVGWLYLIGGITGTFWHSLHNLMTVR